MEEHNDFVDRRAHERIDMLKNQFDDHVIAHVKFDEKLTTIADNTSEIVSIVKGVKGFRHLLVWISPIIVAILAVYEWIRNH